MPQTVAQLSAAPVLGISVWSRGARARGLVAGWVDSVVGAAG